MLIRKASGSVLSVAPRKQAEVMAGRMSGSAAALAGFVTIESAVDTEGQVIAGAIAGAGMNALPVAVSQAQLTLVVIVLTP